MEIILKMEIIIIIGIPAIILLIIFIANKSIGTVFSWYKKCLKLYVNAGGRATRQEYWSFQLFWIWLQAAGVIIGILIQIFINLINNVGSSAATAGLIDGNSEIISIISVVILVANFSPLWTVTVRRLHDIGKGAQWALLCFTTIGAIIVFVFTLLKSEQKANKFGQYSEPIIHIQNDEKLENVDKKIEKKRNFKFTKIIIIIASVIVLFVSCIIVYLFFTSDSNIDIVKDSVLLEDRSISVGEALDNYKYFTNTEWKEFTTSQGREVVEFKGYYSNTDIIIKIQFRMNKDLQEDADGAFFNVNYVGFIYTTAQGEQCEINDDSLLDKIYNNKEITRLSWYSSDKRDSKNNNSNKTNDTNTETTKTTSNNVTYAIVNTNGNFPENLLRMRSTPNTDQTNSNFVIAVPKGETVEILENNVKQDYINGESGYWIKIRYSGKGYDKSATNYYNGTWEGYAWEKFLSSDAPIPASTPLSENEEQSIMSFYSLPKIKTLPNDFEKFLQKFTENKEIQISLINAPFPIYTLDYDNYNSKQITMYNKENLKTHWNFLNKDWFFNNNLSVVFEGKDDIIVCSVFKPNSGEQYRYVFKKINGSWKLFKYINFSD